MKRLLIGLFLAFAVIFSAAPAFGQPPEYNIHLYAAQAVVGKGIFTSIHFSNSSSSKEQLVYCNFYDAVGFAGNQRQWRPVIVSEYGQPWTSEWVKFESHLYPGAARGYTLSPLPGDDELHLFYIEMLTQGVESDPEVRAKVSYHWLDENGDVVGSVGETVAPLRSNWVTDLYKKNGTDIGLAIANPNSEDVTVTIRALDPVGLEMDEVQVVVPKYAQISQFFGEYFSATQLMKWFNQTDTVTVASAGGHKMIYGSLEIEATKPIAVTAMRTDSSSSRYTVSGWGIYEGRKKSQ